MDLDVLTEALDHLREAGPSSFADAESIEVLHGQLARLESFVTGSVAAFDAAGGSEADGARTTAAWLTTRCRLPRREARARVRRGRELPHLPGCASAWERGEITAAHLDVVASLRTEATKEALSRDEGVLVGEACRLHHPGERAAALRLPQPAAQPAGAEPETTAPGVAGDVGPGGGPPPSRSAGPGAAHPGREDVSGTGSRPWPAAPMEPPA